MPDTRDGISVHEGPSRFLQASTGRPKVITKPPLARFDSVDIDASPAALRKSFPQDLAKRHSVVSSASALRTAETSTASGSLPFQQRSEGNLLVAGTRHSSTNTCDNTRRPARHSSTASDKWWTFTTPTQFRQRLDDYLRGSHEEENYGSQGGFSEKYGHHERLESANRRQHGMALALENEGSLTLPHAQTPGWASPWQPFRHSYMEGYGGPSEGFSDNMPGGRHHVTGFFNKTGDFLLYNVFAPILLRVFNMAFTAALIGLAARIQYVEDANDLNGIIGESTIFALVVGPLTLIHVFIAIYLEYFGPPIGIWRLRTKMMATLTELVFISMWAALLSLAFDDYFTTEATCTSWTPNARWRPQYGNSNINGSPVDVLCDDQAVLIAMVFIGLFLYQAVLVISLFRIFSKVSRK